MAENNYWTHEADQGSIKISEDVVASIAAIATTETEGVSGMFASLTSDIIGMLGKKNLSKGVKVQLDGDNVLVAVCFLAKYGVAIRTLAETVQKNVTAALESMTGLTVSAVHVQVGGVTFEDKTSDAKEDAE